MHTTLHSAALCIGTLAYLASSSPLRTPLELDTSLNPAYSSHGLLAKRDITELICGFYSSADQGDVRISEFADKGDLNVPVAGGSCNRIGCYDTSGTYVCNDQDTEINVPMNEIVDHLTYLYEACITRSNDVPGLSGRVKVTDHGGYNVNIGYCNSNHPPSKSPADYSDGWPGVNGEPKQCGKEGQNPCEGTGCVEGSIVVESQEDANCGDYLGSVYVNTGTIYQYSTTRTIGETWSVGAFLSIDTSDLAPVSVQAGFFSSFAKTTTTGSTTGFSKTCGGEDSQGNFTCGALILPRCVSMTGYCETEKTGRAPWAVTVPKVGEDKNSVWSGDLCFCTDCQYDNSDGSAPDTICPLKCEDCPSGDI